jgi:hypothetical protein
MFSSPWRARRATTLGFSVPSSLGLTRQMRTSAFHQLTSRRASGALTRGGVDGRAGRPRLSSWPNLLRGTTMGWVSIPVCCERLNCAE